MMTMNRDDVNSWRQEGLFPAQHVRITCEVIVTSAGQSCTFHVRAVDFTDETCIAAWSLPLRGRETFTEDLGRTVAELLDLVHHHVDPF